MMLLEVKTQNESSDSFKMTTVCQQDCFPDSPMKNSFLLSASSPRLLYSLVLMSSLFNAKEPFSPSDLLPPSKTGSWVIVSPAKEFNLIYPSKCLNPNHSSEVSLAIKDKAASGDWNVNDLNLLPLEVCVIKTSSRKNLWINYYWSSSSTYCKFNGMFNWLKKADGDHGWQL